ncbi:MAG: PAS domain S-box protein [Candidatus Omnitrophica bacterium]|nr:PAS domain S-box protein [Candidatus Omnitrophota bacterium]
MKEQLAIHSYVADRLGIGLFRYAMAPQEQFVSFNKTFVRILGFSSSQNLNGRKIAHLFANTKSYEDFLKTIQEEGKVKFFQTSYKNKNGKFIWISISACFVSDGNKGHFLEGFVEDVTQQIKDRERLTQETDFLQGFLDQMPDAIYFKDRKNRLIKVNKFYSKGFKLTPEEIIGKTDFDFFPQEQAQAMADDDNQVMKTGAPIIGKIERTLLPNGTWNQVITTKVPMYDRKGRITGTMGITRDMTEHANLEQDRLSMLMNALAVLGKALEMRDPYTFQHTCNVAIIAEKIGQEMGFDKNRLIGLKLAAELHDLGKITLPLDLLIKPGKLTKLEFTLIKEHVEKCYDLIKDIRFPFPLADIIYQHHERLDGSGYPQGIKGSKILSESRILAVSDVLEAMTNHRPYRAALGFKKAVDELKDGAGKIYDSEVVEVVLKIAKRNGNKPFWAED